MSARRWGCVVLALAQSCATMTESRSSQFLETERVPLQERTGGRAQVTRSLSVASLTVHVVNTQTCSDVVEVRGSEVVTTVRSTQDTLGAQTLFGAGILGALVGALWTLAPRILLCPRTTSSSSAEPSSCTLRDDGSIGDSGLSEGQGRAVGVAVMGVGALAMLPWLVPRLRAGTSTESEPFSRRDVLRQHDCDPEPLEDVPVTLEGPGGFTLAQSTSRLGDTVFDLRTVLPTQAFEGPAPWEALRIRVRRAPPLQVDLSDIRTLVADSAWRSVEQAHDPAVVERFATRFPLDPRAHEAHERAERIRAERAAVARDHERRTRWMAAGDDPVRLSALLGEPLHDAYAANAECRLARLATDIDDMRINVQRCIHAIDGITPVARDTAPDVMMVAEDIRDAMNARIAEADAATRAEAARVVREAEEAAAREARRAEASRERQRHQQQAAGRSALATAASVASSCRSGHGGCSAAAQAYRALMQGRGVVGASDLRRAVTSVAVACRCTPTQAGTQDPSR